MAHRVFDWSPYYFYSHMPFLMMWRGMKVLMFAYSDAINEEKIGKHYNVHRRWKLAFYNFPYDELQFFSVPHEEPEDVVCSPEMYLDNNGSYILTYSLGKHLYGMPPTYQLYAANADEMMAFYYNGYTGLLREPESITLHDKLIWNGFQHNSLLVYHGVGDDEAGDVHVWTADRLRYWKLTTPFDEVLRTSYTWENHHRLLFTGRTSDGEFRTFIYDWDKHELEGELLVEGHPIYKSTMLGDEVMWSQRHEGAGSNFEERHLMVSTDWEIVAPTVPFHVDIE